METRWPRCSAGRCVSALVVGAGAIVVALLLSSPWAALGLAIGLGLAVVNLRFLDAGVAKLQTGAETGDAETGVSNKVLRRAIGHQERRPGWA